MADKLQINATFNSYAELDQALREYEAETGHSFSCKSSTALKGLKQEQFKFLKKIFACPFRGTFVAKGGGKKQRVSNKTGCLAFVDVRFIDDSLKIEALQLQHNHLLSKKIDVQTMNVVEETGIQKRISTSLGHISEYLNTLEEDDITIKLNNIDRLLAIWKKCDSIKASEEEHAAPSVLEEDEVLMENVLGDPATLSCGLCKEDILLHHTSCSKCNVRFHVSCAGQDTENNFICFVCKVITET